jgi:hypothetical protein
MEARNGSSVKIVRLTVFLAVLFTCDCAEAVTVHPCSADAVAQAKKLLAFYLHFDNGTANTELFIEDGVKTWQVPAIRGTWRYDVLELWGDVYKGRYRMRFTYALVGGECTLMGEEIFEDAIL